MINKKGNTVIITVILLVVNVEPVFVKVVVIPGIPLNKLAVQVIIVDISFSS
ncbi:MAG: hypothetical protein ACTSP4_12670 [Candidatus Hodarchaeales archaeon]